MEWVTEMPRDVAGWGAYVRAMRDPRRRATEIVHAWIDGGLHDWWRPREPRALDRALAACVTELSELAPAHVRRDGRGEVDHDTRRWCWIECWSLSEQDEDLLLMSARCAVPLLEEAAQGCPKRDYALSIVEHGARDGAAQMVERRRSAFRTEVKAYAPWIDLARLAADEGLAAYLARLVSYARPGKVDQAGAVARVADLTRCTAPPSPQAERHGAQWRGSLGGDRVLVIDAAFGEMRVEPR